MCMLRFEHLAAIIPIALLLTLSFFVLSAIRKIEEKGLKVFGYVVAVFLWLATLFVFSGAIFNLGRSYGAKCMMMQHKMKMGGMPQMEQKANMAGMAMPKCGSNKGNF